jgi:hypothetical protein
MLDERTLRRTDFHRGVDVRLADRQFWSLPTPEEFAEESSDSSRAAEHQALTRSILEADSRDDLLRAELSLTIFLLGENYRLSPDACFQVLSFAPGDPLLEESRRALHSLAMEHVRARRTQQSDARSATPMARTPRQSFLGKVRASMSA